LDLAVYLAARADYAVRAMLVLAASDAEAVAVAAGDGPSRRSGPSRVVKTVDLAASQNIPFRLLQAIMADLRQAGLLDSHRGADGGYTLAQPATGRRCPR
jgi:DNA-binding IscR family transcriptional regulator